jgi:hypothetical protein
MFDVLLTADQNLKYQQNLYNRRLAILVLATNRWAKIKTKTADIAGAIRKLRPGDYIELAL